MPRSTLRSVLTGLCAFAACAALSIGPADAATFVGHEHQIQLEPPRLSKAPAIDGRVDESDRKNVV